MLSSALTTKGQVTVPREIRLRLKLQAGDKVGFIVENNHVVLIRKQNNIEAAFGIYRAKRHVSLEEMEKAIKNRGECDRG